MQHQGIFPLLSNSSVNLAVRYICKGSRKFFIQCLLYNVAPFVKKKTNCMFQWIFFLKDHLPGCIIFYLNFHEAWMLVKYSLTNSKLQLVLLISKAILQIHIIGFYYRDQPDSWLLKILLENNIFKFCYPKRIILYLATSCVHNTCIILFNKYHLEVHSKIKH